MGEWTFEIAISIVTVTVTIFLSILGYIINKFIGTFENKMSELSTSIKTLADEVTKSNMNLIKQGSDIEELDSKVELNTARLNAHSASIKQNTEDILVIKTQHNINHKP